MRQTRINILIITIILICIGVVMIYSASNIYAQERFGDGFFFLRRHILFLLIGGFFSLVILSFDYKKIRPLIKPFLLFSIVLLILVLIPGIGRQVSGAQRWFRWKGFSFQPSEMANLVIILYLADFICRKPEQIRSFSAGFLPPVLVLGLMAGLILLQPDLGTSLAMCMVVGLMLYIGGLPISYLIMGLLISLPLFYVMIFKVPYRRQRILTFLNPWADPAGSGFQIIQSQIALGSGGLFGRGLGRSLQKLFFLPAGHTDFIFSIIGEELGFLGTGSVVLLFILLLFQFLKVARNTPEPFGYYLSSGIVILILLKAGINIAVSCGVLPTKGLPLPFISYGGSSLIFDMAGISLLLNIAKNNEVL